MCFLNAINVMVTRYYSVIYYLFCFVPPLLSSLLHNNVINCNRLFMLHKFNSSICYTHIHICVHLYVILHMSTMHVILHMSTMHITVPCTTACLYM